MGRCVACEIGCVTGKWRIPAWKTLGRRATSPAAASPLCLSRLACGDGANPAANHCTAWRSILIIPSNRVPPCRPHCSCTGNLQCMARSPKKVHAVHGMRAPGARPDADFDACCCCAADVAMPSGDSICIVTQHPLPDRLEQACRLCRVHEPGQSVRPASCSPGGYREVYVRAWIRLCCFMSEIRQCSLLTLKYVYQHRQYAYYGADQGTQAAPTVGSSGHPVHDDDGWQE